MADGRDRVEGVVVLPRTSRFRAHDEHFAEESGRLGSFTYREDGETDQIEA
jgi:hypothetical protein